MGRTPRAASSAYSADVASPRYAVCRPNAAPHEHVGRAVADHPRSRARVAGVQRERLLEQAGGRLAAGAPVLGAVEAEVRAQDDAALGGGRGQDRRVRRLQLGARGLPLGGRRLVAGDDEAVPGAASARRSAAGTQGKTSTSLGAHRAVGARLGRVGEQAVEHAVPVEDDQARVRSHSEKSASPAGEPIS